MDDEELNSRIVTCSRCHGEGRIYRGHSNDPDPVDWGECRVCSGTGGEVIKTEPITLDDLCHEECQYARDVAMPEYSCAGECQYRLRAANQ